VFLNAYDQFVGMYPNARENDDFDEFNTRLPEIIFSSIQPVLDGLLDHKRIQMALLTNRNGDSLKYSTHEVDKLRLLANLQAYLRVATDIMAGPDDRPMKMDIKGAKNRLVLSRITGATLIVACDNSETVEENLETDEEVQHAEKLLSTVLNTAAHISAGVKFERGFSH